MGLDPKNKHPKEDIMPEIGQLTGGTSAPTNRNLASELGRVGIFILAGSIVLTIVGWSVGGNTNATTQSDQTQPSGELSASQTSAAPMKITTVDFDKLLGDFNSNEIAASRKYAGGRIQTKDYVSSIRQDNEGAFASLDGGIYAYGSADNLASLHRGDEVQVTCDSATKMTFLYLKNCDIEVLHPKGGFDSKTGPMAMVLDGNGGAYVAGLHRDDTQTTPDSAANVESTDVSSTSPK